MQPTNIQVVQYLNFVNSAYSMFGQDGSDLQPEPINIPAGYNVVAYMSSIDPDSGSRVFFGFLANSTDLQAPAILAIRGTYDTSEYYTDADILPIAFPPYTTDQTTAYVENGFYEFYQGIEWLPMQGSITMTTLQAIGNNQQGIVVVGHSLGGAIATLMVADLLIKAPHLEITLITAASPAVGDESFIFQFNAMATNSYRYINIMDIKASILDIFYSQVNTAIELFSTNIKTTISCEHSLLTYIYLLSSPGTSCSVILDSEAEMCCVSDEDHKKREGIQLLCNMRHKKIATTKRK